MCRATRPAVSGTRGVTPTVARPPGSRPVATYAGITRETRRPDRVAVEVIAT